MALKDQAQNDGAAERGSNPHRPVMQMVASGIFGTVMAATAAGMIVEHLAKRIQVPAFIGLLVALALILSPMWHWFFIVRPERIAQELREEEILKADSYKNGELLEQQELPDDAEDGGSTMRRDRGKLDQDDLGKGQPHETTNSEVG